MNFSLVNNTLEHFRDDFTIVAPLSQVSYIKVFDFESVEINKHRQWIGENWYISIYAAVIYVNLIFIGGHWMKNRQPFQLRRLLTAWNIGLALFSAIGFFRTAPEVFHILKQSNGFHQSVCSRDGHNAATAFWALLMTWSKLVELGDTAFIILKKQPLIFLHWYHHITVLVYVWASFETYEPSLRYFMSMNFFVHAIMYMYYAFKALRIKVPRNIAMMITCLQLSQMVIGVYVNLYLLYAKGKGETFCPDAASQGIHMALMMYASYFGLFANFFYRSYFGKTKKE
ncbi:unnamed protein product [Allacma fusca]|uniref:Elongation of very long chain fatty acids protein n=1 Tax=Allacma fusca TaxID=39272 RepID=A0A8J2PDX3_9HEXA|nr:unnamed protein product [Allacma fusca]